MTHMPHSGKGLNAPEMPQMPQWTTRHKPDKHDINGATEGLMGIRFR
jgi:hypothetical protein